MVTKANLESTSRRALVKGAAAAAPRAPRSDGRQRNAGRGAALPRIGETPGSALWALNERN